MSAKKNRSVKLKASAKLEQRIEVAKLLFSQVEAKVMHADTYRQRNMNYALVIFAGTLALGVGLADVVAQRTLSTTLLTLMSVFCVWDRRWHRIKHGWDSTGRAAYRVMVGLANDPENPVDLDLYKKDGEEEAEWFSWQPVVFYLLVLGACTTFWLFPITGG